MCSSRTLLALAIAGLLPLATAQACGPEFPYRLLSDRAGALGELPEGNFTFEVTRIGQPIAGLAQAGKATLEPYWDEDNQRYLDARVGIEKEQLSAEEHALVSQLRSLVDARQAEAAGAALPAELRLYDRLFTDAQPDAGGKDFKASLNPDSLRVASGYVERSLAGVGQDDKLQFERHGYFVADRHDHAPQRPVFNRIAGLKDSWAR